MKVTETITDAVTGETTVREIDLPGVLTEAEAQAADAEAARLAHNAVIKAQLDANDLKIVRALLEDLPGLLSGGDSVQRIADHKATQAALRAQLIAP